MSKLKSKVGVGGVKRHRNVLRDNIMGVTKPSLRRIARRAGVKRIASSIYNEARGILKSFLEETIHDTITYTEHARRKTIILMDVIHALKRRFRTIYI